MPFDQVSIATIESPVFFFFGSIWPHHTYYVQVLMYFRKIQETRHENAAPSPAAASAATCHRRAVQLQPQAHPLAPLCEVQFVTCSGPSLVTNKLTIHVIVVDRAAAAAAAASVAGAVPSSVVHDEPCVLPFSPEVAPHHRELAAAVASVERACRLCVDVSYSLMTVTSMACQF
jgi:hypothetical protein